MTRQILMYTIMFMIGFSLCGSILSYMEFGRRSETFRRFLVTLVAMLCMFVLEVL